MDDLPGLHSSRPVAALKYLLVLSNVANPYEVRPSILQHVFLLIIHDLRALVSVTAVEDERSEDEDDGPEEDTKDD